MTTDITRPLDREEMANYMTYLNDSYINNTQATTAFVKEYIDYKDKELNAFMESTLDVFSKKLTNIVNIVEASNKYIANTQDKILTAILAVLEGNNNINIKRNPLFYNTMDASKQTLWIKIARGVIARICTEENRNEGSVYKELYNAFGQKGYDLKSLLNEYRQINPKADTLTMIAASGELCARFEVETNRYFHDKIVKGLNDKAKLSKTKKTKKEKKQVKDVKHKVYPSTIVRSTPSNVKKIVARMSSSDVPHGGIYTKAYNLLDIDLDALVLETASRINQKKVGIGYAIGINPKVLAMLDSAVTEYLKQNGGEK